MAANVPQQVRSAIGQPASIRIGRVTAVNPLQVSVQGTVFNDVGTLGTLVPVVGMSVQLVGQSSAAGSDPTSWCVIGPASQPFTGPVTTIDTFPPAVDNPPAARLRQTVAQSIPNGVSTPIVFNVADFDTLGGWNGSTRYTAMVAGRYQVSGGLSYAVSLTGIRTVQWRLNGGADADGTGSLDVGNSVASVRLAARTEFFYLAVGQFIEMTGFQNSLVALNTAVIATEQASMNIRWIGHS